MLLVITGGGTGGHIYPALEVGRLASERGAELLYLGSFRGQERGICADRGIDFKGFDSRPLYSLKSVKGWQSAVRLTQATLQVKAYLKRRNPDVVFSTGGYSAAPVMAAARALRIPYVIHESNSVPGRSNRMFAPAAAALTCCFNVTKEYLPTVERTGQPIRRELREASEKIEAGDLTEQSLVLCLGGSQGSAFLNNMVPLAVGELRHRIDVLLSTGKANFSDLIKNEHSSLRRVPFLEIDELIRAYSKAAVVVARSGGTVAELAMFGLPSVLVPLPTSADDHQLRNAQEFASFGGAEVLEEQDATPSAMAAKIDGWLDDLVRRKGAREALRSWDRSDATLRIVTIVEQTVR